MVLLQNYSYAKSIDGFSSVEYLVVFITIVYGFITSYFFSGWGHMIQNRKKIVFSLEHFSWTVFTFIVLVTNWYASWHKVEYINANIWYFFLSIVPQLCYYFIAVLLFPNHRKGNVNFDNYLKMNRKYIYRCLSIICMVGYVSGIFYDENTFFDSQNLLRLIGAILVFIGSFVKNQSFHYYMIFISLLLLLFFLQTIPSIE